jgi:hypothetical protein
MGDRPQNLFGCASLGTKVRRKDYCWSVRLVYNPTELSGVITARLKVVEVLQLVLELTFAVSQARKGS